MLDLEDLIQWGYIGLINANKTYKESTNASFMTYASTCIINKVKAECIRPRQIKTFKTFGNGSMDMEVEMKGEPVSMHDIIGLEDNNFKTVELLDILDKLPGRERYLFEQHYIYGYQMNEIAKVEGCTPPNISFKIRDAKKRLQRELKIGILGV